MAGARRSRILIVDDSAVMRSLLRAVVSTDAGLEVAGTAVDGTAALSCVETLRPDLILLDVEMPVMDGLRTLRELRGRGHKMPVIMCSSLTQRGAKVTIEALACGASDYVGKPYGMSDRQTATKALAQELVPKILALTTQSAPAPSPMSSTGSSPSQLFGQAPSQLFGQAPTPPPSQGIFPGGPRPPVLFPAAQLARSSAITATPTVLAIGVSTGGPAALDILLPELPANFPLPVLIVQHMPELFTKLLAERLNGRCRLPVREAADGDLVRGGTIFIAKGNWHMEVVAGMRGGASSLRLAQGPLENHCRPAVDVLYRSAVTAYGAGVLGVVLTGMGSDGMLGSKIIREHGGTVLAQDQASSTVWGMPGAVTNAGLAHKVLPLTAMAAEILRLVGRTHSEARELRESVVS